MPSLFNRREPKTVLRPLVSSAYNTSRPITASASHIETKNKRDLDKQQAIIRQSQWQGYAWEYYDLIGQIHFSATIVSSLMSRLKLFPAYVTDDTDIPSHISRSDDASTELKASCRDALSLLSDAPGGLSGMLRSASLNSFIVGEFYLIKYNATAFNGEYWRVHSSDEVVINNEGVFVVPFPGARNTDYIPVTGKFIARIWNPHPRYSEIADSSMRSVIDDCEEYTILGRSVRATGRSKLNAGIMLIPDDLSASQPDDGETFDSQDDPDYLAPYSEAESDTLEDDLMNQFIEPTTDDGSASSVAPLIVRGPSESLKNISYMEVNRKFDAQQIDLYNQALNRILTGIDIPKDIVTGLADVKYANGVNVEDSLYTNHIEPLAMFICDGLTSSFLKPVLRAWGHTEEEIRNVSLWFDASAITTKPDRTESSNFGYQNKLLSGKAWRRNNGYQEDDAPSPEEIVTTISLSLPPTEAIQSAVFTNTVPDLVSTANSAYEETTQDTPDDIINGLTDSDDPTATAPEESTTEPEQDQDQDQSFDDIINEGETNS